MQRVFAYTRNQGSSERVRQNNGRSDQKIKNAFLYCPLWNTIVPIQVADWLLIVVLHAMTYI